MDSVTAIMLEASHSHVDSRALEVHYRLLIVAALLRWSAEHIGYSKEYLPVKIHMGSPFPLLCLPSLLSFPSLHPVIPLVVGLLYFSYRA